MIQTLLGLRSRLRSSIWPRLDPSIQPPPLAVHNLSVGYERDADVLSGIDWVVPRGARVAIVGPNGAGKSTLLKAVLELTPPATGLVEFFGGPLRTARSRVGYVPQRESVDWDFPVSAVEVVAMGRYRRIGWLRPVPRAEREAARACLDAVGLADLADRQIGRLSGGQQQRVFIARALAQEAELYLMDEPFAGIDAASAEVILGILDALREQSRTVVCVQHDLLSVSRSFDRVLLLNREVIADGERDRVFRRANLERTYQGRLAADTLARIDAELG